MSLDDYKDYYQHDPYDYNEHADADINRSPVGDEKPQPYRVRKITHVDGGNREVVLPSKLENLYNEQAKEGYHPIRVEPLSSGPYQTIYGYLVTFYYAPNGPAFTPPF